MSVDKYGFTVVTYGMKLTKYNVNYNSRDIIHSLAKSTSERKFGKFIAKPFNCKVNFHIDVEDGGCSRKTKMLAYLDGDFKVSLSPGTKACFSVIHV